MANGNISPLNVADLSEHVLELLPGVAPGDSLDDNLGATQRDGSQARYRIITMGNESMHVRQTWRPLDSPVLSGGGPRPRPRPRPPPAPSPRPPPAGRGARGARGALTGASPSSPPYCLTSRSSRSSRTRMRRPLSSLPFWVLMATRACSAERVSEADPGSKSQPTAARHPAHLLRALVLDDSPALGAACIRRYARSR